MLLVLLLSAAAVVRGQEPPARLPPVREVWLDTDQLPRGLGPGSWSIVPRQDYASTLQKAQAVAAASHRPPWLLEARYHARFAQHQLHGSAALTVYNPHPVPALARLMPWTLPPTEADPPPGLVGMGERALGVETPAGQVVTRTVQWSLQGEQRGDGTWFQLQLPASAVATFDVDLPFPYRLDWPAGRQYLSGPLPVPGGGDRRWRLTLGGAGRSELQFVIRAGATAAQSAWTEARIDADFVLGAARLEARYECDLQRWQGRLSTVTVDLPPGFVAKVVQARSAGTESQLSWQTPGPGVVQVTFPENVEQRATVVLAGEFPLPADGRLRFELPHVRGVDAVRPTVRIASAVARPLGDWDWGDFGPVQAPEAEGRRDSAVEVLTLVPRRLAADGRSRPASARVSSRKDELAYRQDAWAHWTPEGVRVRVQCQCVVVQGQVGMLSWSVPAGWDVTDIMPEAGTELHAWARTPGGPLLVEPQTPWRTGQTVVLTIALAASPVAVASRKEACPLPQLVPTLPGSFMGSYAVTLARRGALAPPGVTVVRAPGTEAFPAADAPALWAGQAAVPDFYWQLTRPESGELLVREWEPTASVEVRTRVEGGDRVRVAVTVKPAAGAVTRVALQSTETLPALAWHVVGKGRLARWEGTAERSGVLLWAEPLEQPMTLECELPWHVGSRLPLLTSANGTHWLDLPARYRPAGERGLIPDGAGRWRYLAETPPCELLPSLPDSATPERAVLLAVVRGASVEFDFSAVVPARREAVTLLLPAGVKASQAWLQERAVDAESAVVVPASPEPIPVRLRYRLPVHRTLGVSWADPGAPTLDGAGKMEVRQKWRFLSPVATAPGWGAEGSAGDQQSVVADTTAMLWWVERGDLAACGLLGCLALLLLGSRVPSRLAAGLVILLVLAVFILPGAWAWLPLGLATGLVPTLLGARLTRAFGRIRSGMVVLVVVVALSPTVGAQGESDPVLVYLFPAERRQDERAVLPTELWSQLQVMSRQDLAGLDLSAVVESVRCEAEWTQGRLRVSAVWGVRVRGEGPAELPWPGPARLVEASVDGTLISPRLLPGPFGMDRLVLRLSGPGRHELRCTYDVSPRQASAMSMIELPLPAAPVQTVRVTLPGRVAGMTLAGTSGARTVTHEGNTTILRGDAGLAGKITLSWFTPQLAPADVEARAGVLWEHRLSQSVAHALVRYEIEHGATDVLELDVPAGVRVRAVSLIGEVQATVSPRVAEWTLRPQGEVQRLSVRLLQPVSGVVHLLVELPWDRAGGAQAVPLAGVWPAGVTVSDGFVAYLADGLDAEPAGRLAPVPADQLDFARAWLPSLALLPPNAITRLTSPRETTPMIRLKTKANPVRLSRRQEVVIGDDGVTSRCRYEVEAEEGLPSYLSARVEPWLNVTEVRGPHVVRWQQTSAADGGPARLEVWLKVRPATDRTTVLNIVANSNLPWPSPEKLTLKPGGIAWEQASEEGALLIVMAARAGLVETAQAPVSLRQLPGPWADASVVAEYAIPSGDPPEQPLVVCLRRQQQLPSAAAELRRSAEGTEWVLTVAAKPTAPLPPHLDVVLTEGTLQESWSIAADVPVAAVPRRDAAGRLVWSLQFTRPAARLTLRSQVPEGAATPAVTFPLWPGLVVSAPP